MIKYGINFKLSDDLLKSMSDYSIKKDCVTNFHIAKVFIDQIIQKQHVDEVGKLFNDFLTGKVKTIGLKKLLKFTSYDDSDIKHFNAFQLIDTVNFTRA